MIEVAMTGEVDRSIPHAETDGTDIDPRLGRYREQYVISLIPTMHGLSDEGTYLVATNPVPGTGIAFAVNASVNETIGNYIHLKNNDVANSAVAKRIYLHYIRLIVTAVPVSGISGHFFIKTDNVNRYTSGGTVIIPTSPNTDSGAATIAILNVGALTTIAPSQTARLVTRAVLRSAIPVLNDEYNIQAGSVDFSSNTGLGGVIAQRIGIPAPGIIIGPQQNMCMQIWFPSNAVTPVSFEFEMGWFER